MKTTSIKSLLAKAFLLLPLVFFTFCDTQEELVFDSSKNLLTKDSKVVELLTKMATKNMEYGVHFKSSTTTPECTGFKYPIVFDAYYGDNPTPQEFVVNSDEELLQFFNTMLTPENPYYVLFPVTLLDAEGIETEVYSLEDLENILELALDICYNDDDNDDSSDDDYTNDDNNDDNDSGNDDDNNDSGNDDDNDDSGDDDDDYKYCDKNKKKVSICHKGINICVSVNAIWGHLNHHEEDYLGPCN